MTHETPIKQRLRITFGKLDALKYTGHLDTARVWERVLRRAEIPILYSQGFNARPRLQVANPLPLGISSECEIIDVMLKEQLPTLDGLGEKLESVSPDGLTIIQIVEVDARAATLQTLVSSAEYCISFPDMDDTSLLQEKIDTILAAEEILIQKKAKRGKTKTVNLRPSIHSLHLDDDGNLIAHLTTGDKGNLRPDVLLQQMGLDAEYSTVHRLQLHLEEEEA
jgi:radical SAM-linked protein